MINLYEHLFESANRVEGVMEDFGEDFALAVFKTGLAEVVTKSRHFYYEWFIPRDMVRLRRRTWRLNNDFHLVTLQKKIAN